MIMKRRGMIMRRRVICWMLVASLVMVPTVQASGLTSATADPSQQGQSTHLVMMVVYAVVALGFSFLCSVAEAVVLSVTPSFIAPSGSTPASSRTAALSVEPFSAA